METINTRADAADPHPLLERSGKQRARRRRSRPDSTALYGCLSAAYDSYTRDVPEASFPSFLESQLLDELGARAVSISPTEAWPQADSRGAIRHRVGSAVHDVRAMNQA